MADCMFLCSSTIGGAISSLISRTSGIDKTIELLLNEAQQLKDTRDEVDGSVTAAERRQWVPRSEVKRWLNKAEGVLKELDEFERRYWAWKEECCNGFGFLLSCGFPVFCAYAMGARAGDLLIQIRQLRSQKIDLNEVANAPSFVVVERIPPPTLPRNSYRKDLEEIQSYLRDDAVGLIAVCGIGEVVKYSLMATINNDTKEHIGTHGSCGFDVVIWIYMSKSTTEEQMRRKIAQRCCLQLQPQHEYMDDLQLPQLLFNFLSTKRFLLLLGDLWQAFDMAKVGIPIPDSVNKCKIIFSTRSEYVCSEMEAQRSITIDVMDEERSWELFSTKVSSRILRAPEIMKHAKAMVAACGGLPLAILRVGRAMANKTRPKDWERACREMAESPMKIRGMDDVCKQLKESFDALSSDLSRKCLIHFSSAFPDRDEVDEEELVDSMIKGGLLGVQDRAGGYDAIQDLKALFLLSKGTSNELIKLHPMVRMMAMQQHFVEAKQEEEQSSPAPAQGLQHALDQGHQAAG